MHKALIINIFLFVIFGIQHSGMARKGFKKWLTGFLPKAVERSTYIVFSNIALMTVLYFWEPMGGVIWYFESTFARQAIIAIYIFGWALVLFSSFLINHFHLFGLQQTWGYFINKNYNDDHFVTPWIYTVIRHPLYVGWFILVWAAPTLTVAHLVFSLCCTLYIYIGVRFEEKDLVDDFGDSYKTYQSNVPMLIPGTKFKKDINAKTSISSLVNKGEKL